MLLLLYVNFQFEFESTAITAVNHHSCHWRMDYVRKIWQKSMTAAESPEDGKAPVALAEAEVAPPDEPEDAYDMAGEPMKWNEDKGVWETESGEEWYPDGEESPELPVEDAVLITAVKEPLQPKDKKMPRRSGRPHGDTDFYYEEVQRFKADQAAAKGGVEAGRDDLKRKRAEDDGDGREGDKGGHKGDGREGDKGGHEGDDKEGDAGGHKGDDKGDRQRGDKGGDKGGHSRNKKGGEKEWQKPKWHWPAGKKGHGKGNHHRTFWNKGDQWSHKKGWDNSRSHSQGWNHDQNFQSNPGTIYRQAGLRPDMKGGWYLPHQQGYMDENGVIHQ